MDPIRAGIEVALAKLREHEILVVETKKTINGMRKLIGEPPMFPDADVAPSGQVGSFRSDQFYGQPLSTVVRQILEARKDANLGSAAVNELYQAMLAGGYKFETANEENAKRVLRISLTKNSSIFHRLPNGEYGLRSWYPTVKDGKEGKPKAASNGTDQKADPPGGDDPSDFDFDAKEKADDVNVSA
jgi:hypothetical protein